MKFETSHPAQAREQGERSTGPAPQLRWPSDWTLLTAYGLALVAYALVTPLQVPELEAVGWSVRFQWNDFWYWPALGIDPSPVGNLIELPFVHFLGVSRLATRLPGILLACGSAFLILRLANRVVPKRRHGVLLLFVTLPLQLMILTASVQYEAATFLSIAAMLAFFAVLDHPVFKTAIALALLTGVTLFTDHHAAVPIFGAVLFLLRFSPRAQDRRALWYALGACVVAAIPYVPYYIWSNRQINRHWLADPGIPTGAFPPEMTALEMVLFGAAIILVAGALVGGYASFQMSQGRIHRRISLFCLLGSVVLTLLFLIGPNYYFVYPVNPRDLMFAAPQTILIFTATIHWVLRKDVTGPARVAAIAASLVVLIAFLAADLELIAAPKDNFALETKYVAPELKGDSCVVFTSEFFSRPLFLLIQPELQSRECVNFFHHRIVLASHPYVRPDQQQNAESFFRGLNFRETKRIRAGGGEIVVYQEK
jgi:4-amino-4-deoxy-L-arabinose transferase-like glycosyltransferase